MQEHDRLVMPVKRFFDFSFQPIRVLVIPKKSTSRLSAERTAVKSDYNIDYIKL